MGRWYFRIVLAAVLLAGLCANVGTLGIAARRRVWLGIAPAHSASIAVARVWPNVLRSATGVVRGEAHRGNAKWRMAKRQRADGGAAVLARVIRVCGSVTESGVAESSLRIASSSRTVPSPIARMGWAIVVRGGSV